MKKVLLISTAVAALLGGPALAADMPLKAPQAAPVYGWGGVYFAGSLGGAWGKIDDHVVFPGFVGFDSDFHHKPSSVIAGAHVGIQQQWGPLVLGAEASFNATALQSGPLPGVSPEVQTARINDYFTATGKVGFVFSNQWMAYVRGGYANGEVGMTIINTSNGNVVEPSHRREDGWTLGGGIDYRVSSNVLVGVNYEFVRFNVDDRLGRFIRPTQDLANIVNARAEVQAVTARVTVLLWPFGQ